MINFSRCLLLAGSSLAISASAFAQDPAPVTPSSPGQSTLEDIVVTAQKRSEKLQNVPIAVTALSSTELKSGNIDGQLTLPKLTPNLNFAVVATFAATYIRGVGTQYANPGLEPSVPVYFDDTYIPRAAAGVFNFVDLERIEVLKGPQGTLYGRNATGGAIRVITNDPKLGKFEGLADVTYGTDNRFKIGGVINVPLGDHAAIRVAAQHDENHGYLQNLAPNRPGKAGTRNSEMYTAKLIWEPSSALRIKVSADYSDKRDDEGMTFQNIYSAPQQVGIAFGGCGQGSSFYSYCNDLTNSGDKVKAWGVTGRLDYDIGSATLSSTTAYRKETEDDTADLDATGARLLSSHGIPFTRQFTQEFQIASNGKQRLRYVAGLYYLTERASYVYNLFGAAIDGDPNYTALAGFLGVTGPLNVRAQGPGVKTTSFAPYAQVDFDVTDKLTLTAGARYTIEKKALLGYDEGFATNTGNGNVVPGTFVSGEGLAALGIPGLGGICTTPGQALCRTTGRSIKFNKLTPKLTISYKPNADLLLYATASRGFKSGGFNLPAYAYVDSVDPEVLDDVEGGLKYQSGGVRFNAAVFYYNYKNLQVQITDPLNGTTFNRNGANAHNYGAEGDLTWRMSQQFEVGVGGGYLHAKYTSFPLGNCFVPNYIAASCAGGPVHPAGTGAGAVGNSFLPANLAGYTLVNSPRLTGYARAQFTQPVDGVGTFALSGIANYRSKAYFDIASQLPDKERVLLSARLQWTSESKRFGLAVYGENLGGVHYYVSRTAQAAGGFQVPAAPRQIYVSASATF